MKHRNKGRAVGQTQISVSVPEILLGEIDAIATEEGRNRSNTIVHLLRLQLKARKGGKSEPRAIVPATPEQVAAAIRRGPPFTPEELMGLTVMREQVLLSEVKSGAKDTITLLGQKSVGKAKTVNMEGDSGNE